MLSVCLYLCVSEVQRRRMTQEMGLIMVPLLFPKGLSYCGKTVKIGPVYPEIFVLRTIVKQIKK